MERELRKKFVIISIASVFTVLLLIFGFINISNYRQISVNADQLIQVIADNNGKFPRPEEGINNLKMPKTMSPEAPFSTRFFTVRINETGNINAIDTGRMFSVTTEDAITFTEMALSNNTTKGYVNTFRYRIVDVENTKLLIFVDSGREIQIFRDFLNNSILISIIALLGIFVLISILSKKVVAPIVKSIEKQKMFITNVSHELKTPLTIISTNMDVEEMERGESKWTTGTKNQVKRLNKLVEQLLVLSKLDEENTNLIMTDFSISDATKEVVDNFLILAEYNNLNLNLKIHEHLSYYGNEETIRQLISLLIDNSIKHGKSGSTIDLMLDYSGNRIVLTIKNEAEGLEVKNYNHLFDRFYKEDKARNTKSNSYGIGLSIGNSIVEKHGGKLEAYSSDGIHLIVKVSL